MRIVEHRGPNVNLIEKRPAAAGLFFGFWGWSVSRHHVYCVS